MEKLSASRTMRGERTAAEARIKPLKTRQANAQLALKKLFDESTRTEASLLAEIFAAEEFHNAERTPVERLECELLIEIEK